MVQFGFKELIDKLEEYYGRSLTKVAVGLCILAVILFLCAGAVTSVYPLTLWIGAVITGEPAVSNALSGISTVATVVWLVVVLALVVSYFQHRKDLRHSTELLTEIRTLQADIEEQEDTTRERLRAMVAEAQKLLDDAGATVGRAEEALAHVAPEEAAPTAPKSRKTRTRQA